MENLAADELDAEIIELSEDNYLEELYNRRAFTLWRYLVDNPLESLVDMDDPEYSSIQIRRFFRHDAAQQNYVECDARHVQRQKEIFRIDEDGDQEEFFEKLPTRLYLKECVTPSKLYVRDVEISEVEEHF